MLRTRPSVLGVATVLVSLVVLPVLAGCGTPRVATDPFVGTWLLQPFHGRTESEPIVIARAADGYVATVVYRGSGLKPASPRPTLAIPLTRQGDKLVGTYKVDNESRKLEIGYVPQSGNLTWATSQTPGGPMTRPLEMTKVSDATTIPTPSP